MSDSTVSIKTGSDADVATDAIAGKHHQKIKVMLGVVGTAVPLDGDATYGADVDVTRLPALKPENKNTNYNAVECEVKTAYVNTLVAADNTIVTAVTAKRIRVLSVMLVADGAVNMSVKSGASTTLIEPMAFALGVPMCQAVQHGCLFETASGEALIFNCDAVVRVRGSIQYIER